MSTTPTPGRPLTSTPDVPAPPTRAAVILLARTIGKAAAAVPSEALETAIDQVEATLHHHGTDEQRAELELLRAFRRYRIDLEELAALALDVPLTTTERLDG